VPHPGANSQLERLLLQVLPCSGTSHTPASKTAFAARSTLSRNSRGCLFLTSPSW
jgi:hypothetical protein